MVVLFMYIDFLHYFLFVFVYFIIYVALWEELRSEEFHCLFYTVAAEHLMRIPLNLNSVSISLISIYNKFSKLVM